MLLYALLHLTGYDLPLEEIKRFRQWGSKTPGHPEFGLTPGVEATTGPLGQGFANAVGMAITERHLAARFNRPGHQVVDHNTYVLCSDGDLMEGVAAEAASLAGHLGLGKLIALYDDNQVSLAGKAALSFSEDVPRRLDGLGWHTAAVPDGNDLEAIDGAIRAARAETARPSLIAVRTIIGFGAPKKAGTHEAHGEPLGDAELRGAKQALGWPLEPSFLLPEPALGRFRAALAQDARMQGDWQTRFDAWARAFADLATEWRNGQARALPPGWDQDIPRFPADTPMATRDASGAVLAAVSPRVPYLMGGDADLAPSTKTLVKTAGSFGAPRPRPPYPLRRARARDGVDRQRHRVSRGLLRLLRHLLRLLGLHASGRAAGRALGAPGHVRLDARLHRRRGGRADARARRASGRPPRDAASRRDPSGGCRRDGGGLAGGPRAPRPDRAGSLAAEAPGVRPRDLTPRPKASGAEPTCSRRRRAARPTWC
jgi:transketolase N-terminal domain/subunit